jgi:hypothetical protein
LSELAADRALRVVRSRAEWDSELPPELAEDLYYRWEYLEVWARETGAEPLGLCFEADGCRVLYPLLRQPLDALAGGAGRSDLRTPYDFGGPRVVLGDPIAALARFDEAFRRWCERTGVVTEFARLHPLALPAVPADAALHSDNFVVDLRLDAEALAGSQHATHRRAVRAARGHGLAFELISRPSSDIAATWTRLYAETMARVEAPAVYDFSPRLFADLLALPLVRLARVVDRRDTLSAAIVVESGEDLFYFLGGSTLAGRERRANNLLFDGVIESGRREAKRYLHLGGGSSSLRQFKRHLSTGAVPYFVRRRIHDAAHYERLRASTASEGSSDFPSYREFLMAALREASPPPAPSSREDRFDG